MRLLKNLVSKENRVLLSEMIRTDFKLRYQGSVLGYLWSLLRPLMLFLILHTVFVKFLQIGKGVPNWPVSLLLGIVLWSFFVEATSSALKSVVGRGSLIRKINIPRYIIPVSVVASALINMFFNMIVVFVFIFLTADNAPLSWQTLVVLPLLIVELIIFSTAVGFFLGTLMVKYRDIEHIWDIIRQGLFYAIPIIYPLAKITSVHAQKLLMLNPLAQIIQDARAVTTYAGTDQLVDLYANRFAFLVPIAITILVSLISIWFFRKRAPYFAEDI